MLSIGAFSAFKSPSADRRYIINKLVSNGCPLRFIVHLELTTTVMDNYRAQSLSIEVTECRLSKINQFAAWSFQT